jgi:creatinine amidohydrolase
MLLENLTWPEVKKLGVRNQIVLLPLGSFEQHGPHLPLTTDTDIVTAIARAVEAQRSRRVLCLPTLWPGHSTHHLFFPGTLSVSQMPYISLVLELCGSIVKMGGRRIFLLNGHGGNDVPIRAALREVKSAFPKTQFVFASYWSLAAQTIKGIRKSELGGLGHACEMETSIMLHLHPKRVKFALARRDGPKHKDPYRRADMQYARPVYFVNEFDEVTKTGTIGHPELATAEKGKRFLDGIVKDVLVFIDEFAKWK